MAKAKATVRYRPIQGFPGYRVGDDGSVWSRWIRKGNGQGRAIRVVLGRVWRRLRQTPSGHGYLVAGLSRGPGLGRRMYYIHRLVLEAFVGPCPPGMECCHRDGDGTNNVPGNLRWGTRLSNMADRIRHGTSNRGELGPAAKLNTLQVQAIRSAYAAGGVSQHRLAHRYGVAQSVIHAIVRMKSWFHTV